MTEKFVLELDRSAFNAASQDSEYRKLIVLAMIGIMHSSEDNINPTPDQEATLADMRKLLTQSGVQITPVRMQA